MRRAIRDAVLRDVHVEARTESSHERFPRGAARNFLYAEIFGLGIIAMQKCCGDPDLIRHFQLPLGLYGHGDAPV